MEKDIDVNHYIAAGRRFEAELELLRANPQMLVADNRIPEPAKLVLAYPDTIEVMDKEGKAHTYSLTELLDGLYRLAKNSNKRAKKDKK